MQRVVRAIECAGFAMGELAKEREDINKTLLNTVVKSFLEQLQVVHRRVYSVRIFSSLLNQPVLHTAAEVHKCAHNSKAYDCK
jgi:hypothetical protein